MTSDPARELPILLLEQLRLGELPRDDAARVRRIVDASSQVRDRLDALARSDDEIRRTYSPGQLAARALQLAAAADGRGIRPRTVRRIIRAAALAASSVALVIALAWPGRPPSETERLKGAPALMVYRRTPTGSETLANGAAAHSGDLLRLGYLAAGSSYGVIISIDGRGGVTLHLPRDGDRSAALKGGGAVLLEEAFELDDAPAWERFYFVTSDHEFDIAPVLQAARRAAAESGQRPAAALRLPDTFRQSMFALQKEVKP